MHVPQLRSTEHDQEAKRLLLCDHPQAETQEGISLVEIPLKSQYLTFLYSVMWAHLSVTVVWWLPDDCSSKTSNADYPFLSQQVMKMRKLSLTDTSPQRGTILHYPAHRSTLHCSCPTPAHPPLAISTPSANSKLAFHPANTSYSYIYWLTSSHVKGYSWTLKVFKPLASKEVCSRKLTPRTGPWQKLTVSACFLALF